MKTLARFSNIQRLASVALLAIAAGTSCLGQFRNTGFELAGGTAARNWQKFGNAFREPLGAHSGTYSMKLFGNFTGGTNASGVYQDFPISPGESVSTSAWALNRNADPMSGDNYALLKVIYRDAFNNDLASSESNFIRANTSRDIPQFVTASLAQAPAGTHHGSLYLLFIQPSSSPFAGGATFFDDVTVRVSAGSMDRLLWQDEFNGTALNTSIWEPMIGDGSLYGTQAGWGNNELQYYTARSQNVSVSNGLLHIVARKENYQGKQYTSARLRTLGKRDLLYGRIEARIKVPAGQGFWPAFWMLPSTSTYAGWAAGGEIDIIETVNNASTAYGTIHFGGQWPQNVQSGGTATRSGGYADGYHVYRIDWEPDSIRWYVDDVLYFTRTSRDWYTTSASWKQRAPFDDKFHLLLNLAIGGNWPGSPNGSSVFPAEMSVDWVRVYGNPKRSDPAGGGSPRLSP